MEGRLPHQNEFVHGFLLPDNFPLKMKGGRMDYNDRTLDCYSQSLYNHKA